MKTGFSPVTTSEHVPLAPPGWRWSLLKNVARLESGHTPSRREPAYWEGGNVPWLSLKDIRGLAGRYVTATEDMPTQAGIDNSSARVLPKGTVAFCRTASVGKVAILGRDMATSQDFANWVCGPELLPEYLYEALGASGRQFEKEKQGTTHKTIYMPVLERFRVLMPPLAEQRRIADILDKANAIRRKRKEAMGLTEELLRSAFLEVFGDPVTNPKKWPVEMLGGLCNDDLRYGTSVRCSTTRTEGDVAILRIPNVVAGRIDWSDLKYTSLDEGERARLFLRRGDILFVRSNGNPEYIGRCAVIDDNQDAAFASYLIRARLVDPEGAPYVHAALSTVEYRRVLTAGARTTAGNFNISAEALRALVIPVPPRPLQRHFATIVGTVHSSIARQHDAAAEADALVCSLAARAFAGEIS
ncbi:MAG: restriction endonuclease subunit S [Deltaproteobacteria bacterium]|nr:restriction endonuclease subunit S [Deltaproteobacteria bacterium]